MHVHETVATIDFWPTILKLVCHFEAVPTKDHHIRQLDTLVGLFHTVWPHSRVCTVQWTDILKPDVDLATVSHNISLSPKL